VLKKCVGDICG
jgi:hypothetical protein